jgi:hypothetical protein
MFLPHGIALFGSTPIEAHVGYSDFGPKRLWEAEWHLDEKTRYSVIGSLALSLLFRRLKLPKGPSLHSLRHSHCSHLLASGVLLPAVSARPGAWVDTDDPGNLLAYDPRARRRGGAEMGGVPESADGGRSAAERTSTVKVPSA